MHEDTTTYDDQQGSDMCDESKEAHPLPTASGASRPSQWLQEEILEAALSCWKQQLAGAPPVLKLPIDRPRPDVHTFHGAIQSFTLPIRMSEELKALSRQEGVPLFITLLAAFMTLLHRYTDEDDLVVGIPIATYTEVAEQSKRFFNTLVIRADLSCNPRFQTLLEQVQKVTLDAYAHRDLPFERLLEALPPERNLSYNPLCQVSFILENTSLLAHEFPGSTKSLSHACIGAAPFDLSLVMKETEQGLNGVVEYNSDLFDAATIIRIIGHFWNLVEGIVVHPEQRLLDLPLLTEAERQQLLVDWNATETAYPRDVCLHQLFEAQVERTPDAVAVIFENEQMTYQELNRLANQLAHYLRRLGVEPEVRVGLCMERSMDLVVGLLGILKAGGAYVPLDPTYPQERLAFILDDVQVRLLLTQDRLVAELPQYDGVVVRLDADWSDIVQESGENPISEVTAENLAYVIYTSGSTGTPKGVMISHRAICNHLLWKQLTYPLTEMDRLLQIASFGFDISVWELFGPLLSGARLVVVPPGRHWESAYLVNLIAEQQITVVHFVPSMLQVFLEEQGLDMCNSLRLVLSGGESLPFELQERFFARLDAELHNLYGPTEASVDVTWWNCRHRAIQPVVPIGRPIANTQIYLLDAHLQPVPIGVQGELYIGGVNLARGYLKRPDLTAERFIPDAFSNKMGARLYKTGDLARYLPDGSIVILGRIDHQVKIRGFRIELGEIEAVLGQHSDVRNAAVVVREDTPGNKRLVAYVVPVQKRASTIAGRQRYKLLNNMAIVHLNKNETDFLYKEIFETSAYLRNGITINDGDCIFDVGANIGLFMLFAHQRCKNISVYAFEPNPFAFKLLDINASIYEVKAKLFECGLSNETKSDMFTFYRKFSFLSGFYADTEGDKEVVRSFIRNQQQDDLAEATSSAQLSGELEELLEERFESENLVVQLKTLSDIIRENNIEHIDLLKINVEKSEFDVITGIREGDWEKIHQIVMEVHDIDGRLDQVITLLKSHGYNLVVEQDWSLERTKKTNYYVYAIRSLRDCEIPKNEMAERSVSAPSNPMLSIDELRSFLKGKLPDYMVPSAFVMLDALPLTPSGKIDRQALPPPMQARSEAESTFVAPRTSTEEVLARIWAKVLGLKQVSIYDNFFDLGGHSLVATQVISRVRHAFSVELPVHSVFETPTVAELAKIIEASKGREQGQQILPMQPISRDHHLPLSFSQEQVWFLNELAPGNIAYNFQQPIHFKGHLNVAVLEQTLTEIVRRHEILRTSFVAVDGRPMQIIHAPYTVKVPIVDLRGVPESQREVEAERLILQEGQKAFDIARIPLIRWTLLQLSADEHILIQAEHHFVHDGWSLAVILREMKLLYTAFSRGECSPLPELSIQYADFAAWQRQLMQGEVLEAELAYWTEKLAGSSFRLELPTSRPRPKVQSFRGAVKRVELPVRLYESLRAFSRRERVTLFMLLLTAFATLLYRYTSQDDILIGSSVANRRLRETEELLGMIVNMVILRTDLSGNPSFQELLRRVRTVTTEAYTHQDLPFAKLMEVLQPERDLSRNPLFQVAFSFHDSPVPDMELPELSGTLLERNNGSAKFDLNVIVIPHAEQHIGQSSNSGDESIVVLWEYSTDLFDEATITRMAAHFQTVLERIVAHPEQRLSEIPLLTDAERHQLLVEWNGTAAPVSGELLHTLFEAQVPLRPFQEAVVCSNRSLTYEELYRRSTYVGHRLRNLGTRPNTLVAVVMEKGWEQVVAVLGILQAGAAYVPLDPKLPKERLWYLLKQSEVELVLSQTWVDEYLDWPETVQRLCVDDAGLADTNDRPMRIVQRPDDLAYVIFTSGSTGLPKGVMIDHLAAVNTILDINRRFGITSEDRVLALSSLSFDLSVYDIFGTLAAGGTIVIPDAARMQDPAHWADVVVRNRVTVWDSVPALLQLLVDYAATHPEVIPRSLRLALLSGDWIPVTLPDQLRALVNNVQAISLGGATEASIWSIHYPIGAVDPAWKSIPYGRPLANQCFYVLNEALEPCPVGIPGVLHIAGIGLAKGYWRDEERTCASFFTHPRTGERLYRTGDMGRYLPDGNIEFLGRLDHQVKVRGFRIELGEIEATLSHHPAVREVVVMAREDVPGDKRLVAYIVVDQEQAPTISALRSYLQEKLPDYMVPSVFILLDALPLTPNGKVNRQALPAPDGFCPELDKTFVPARNPIEEVLVGIWADVLGITKVGIYDSFFALGGHSLSATRVISRIRDLFGVDLPLRSIFTSPMVADLAEAVMQRLGEQDNDHNMIINRRDAAEVPVSLDHLSDEEMESLLNDMLAEEEINK